MYIYIYLPRNSSLSSKTLEILRKSFQNKFIAWNKIPFHAKYRKHVASATLKSNRWALAVGLSDTNLKSRDSCYHLKQAPQREIITVYPKKKCKTKRS